MQFDKGAAFIQNPSWAAGDLSGLGSLKQPVHDPKQCEVFFVLDGLLFNALDWPVRWLAGRVPEGTYVFSASCRLSFRGAVSFPLRWETGRTRTRNSESRASQIWITRFISSLWSGSCCDEGICPITEVVMKSKELKETLRLIVKVSSNSRVEPGQRDQLERARRELTNVARSGKLEEDRMFRAAEIIAKVLSEVVARDKP